MVFTVEVNTSSGLVLNPLSFEQDDGSNTNRSFPTENSLSKPVVAMAQRVDQDLLSSKSSKVPVRGLEEIMKSRGPLERSTALLNVLREADEDQILNLLEQSKKLDPPAPIQTQALIVQRLVRVNPSSALVEVQRFNTPRFDYLLTALFSEWSQFDLNEALTHATTLSIKGKLAALEGILLERHDLGDSKRREIARQLSHEQVVFDLIKHEKLNEAIDAPGRVWKEIVKEAQNEPKQFELLAQIALIWIEKEGLGILDQILESLDNAPTRSWIANSVLSTVAQLNPNDAFEYALKLKIDPSNESKIAVIQEWVISDPRVAQDAVSSVEHYGLRQQLQECLIKTWAAYDPHELLTDLDLLPSEFIEMATEDAIKHIASGNPEKAAEIVSTLENETFKFDAARMVVRGWFRRDFDATFDWISNHPNLEVQRNRLLKYLVALLSERRHFERAMEVALGNAVHETEIGLEAYIVGDLARRDLDTALAEYLPQVREGLTKTEAYRYVGSELVKTGQTEKALELVQQIPEYVKEEYLSQVLGGWAALNPQSLYDFIEEIPSKEVSSQAALILLLNDLQDQQLSSDQTKALRDQLTAEDMKQLER